MAKSESAREGSLDAPTRRPIDWRSPDFYDEAAVLTRRLAEMLAHEPRQRLEGAVAAGSGRAVAIKSRTG